MQILLYVFQYYVFILSFHLQIATSELSCTHVHISTGVVYKLWFRHTRHNTDYIPYIQAKDLKEVTLDDLKSASQKYDITHMYISGNIPTGLHEIAPNLRQLRLRNIPHEEQLLR